MQKVISRTDSHRHPLEWKCTNNKYGMNNLMCASVVCKIRIIKENNKHSSRGAKRIFPTIISIWSERNRKTALRFVETHTHWMVVFGKKWRWGNNWFAVSSLHICILVWDGFLFFSSPFILVRWLKFRTSAARRLYAAARCCHCFVFGKFSQLTNWIHLNFEWCRISTFPWKHSSPFHVLLLERELYIYRGLNVCMHNNVSAINL